MTAFPRLLPLRAMVSTTTPPARPVMPLNVAHTSAPTMASGTRLERSAYCAIGTCSASAAIDESATSPSTLVLSSPNSSRMLGSRMPKAVRSSSSTALRPNSTASG